MLYRGKGLEKNKERSRGGVGMTTDEEGMTTDEEGMTTDEEGMPDGFEDEDEDEDE